MPKKQRPKKGIRASLQQQYQRWLSKRLPKQQAQILNQRRLFIFPTLQGFAFLAVCGLVLIAAVNYQNNLAYIVVFFMLSLLNTGILFTFINVSGLKLEAGDSEAGFAGEHVAFHLKLSQTSQREHHQILLSFKGQTKTQLSLTGGRGQVAELVTQVTKRGVFQAQRICIESIYPLGLIKCWTWIDLDMQALVYPKPIHCDVQYYAGCADEGDTQSHLQGDDFYGLRAYQYGDSLTQSHWPSLAKGQTLQQKQYVNFIAKNNTLDFQQFHQGHREETLSKLCHAVITLNKKNEAFSLILPTTTLGLSSGDKHLHQALAALAVC